MRELVGTITFLWAGNWEMWPQQSLLDMEGHSPLARQQKFLIPPSEQAQ